MKKGYKLHQGNHIYTKEIIRDKIMACRDQLKIFRGRWTLEVLYSIKLMKKSSFNELLNEILPGINSRTLSNRLRTLEKKHFIKRTVLTESPIRVKYEITEFGDQAITLLFPFILFCMIPKRLRKKYLNFPTIKKLTHESILQKSDELKQIKSNDNIQTLN